MTMIESAVMSTLVSELGIEMHDNEKSCMRPGLDDLMMVQMIMSLNIISVARVSRLIRLTGHLG